LNIICQKNCPTTKDELKYFLKAYKNRDTTIGEGFILLKQHYDVHRWHPPLIYGRRGDADEGEGISLAIVFAHLLTLSSRESGSRMIKKSIF